MAGPDTQFGRGFLKVGVVLFACTALFLNCGTNTNQPVFPLYVFSTVGSPAISSLTAVQTNLDPLDPQMAFDLRYYITNSEDGFLGYNLYITSSSTSAQGSLVGTATAPYMPNGTSPTFSHVGAVASTAQTSIVTQRVSYQVAPPATKQFQYCELYYFRLTALTRAGIESAPSAQASSCAAINTALCPSGTPCRP
ncbi:MAG TPA: hypothetical protein PKE49_07470 [Leptospiraceae bacterium]|jgi:hypothetical protein|nr:hypothetical protein [Leptospirales bacterium]HMX56347.1 hypothetical protein [Leptospiraceae bacterium]HMY45849.1 hypothetical protein [Leptospiraceae bacterium]HNE22027.1 hypothetical protein [Leptospiraceae bacterium]HNN60123.1 hypothetical protein [Leptospiraceae bacterium]